MNLSHSKINDNLTTINTHPKHGNDGFAFRNLKRNGDEMTVTHPPWDNPLGVSSARNKSVFQLVTGQEDDAQNGPC
jgi:hypothetical protein